MANINTAIERAGSATALAKGIGVPVQSIVFWRQGARRIPAEYCPDIEAFTAGEVTCEDLRPDVNWGVLRAKTHTETE